MSASPLPRRNSRIWIFACRDHVLAVAPTHRLPSGSTRFWLATRFADTFALSSESCGGGVLANSTFDPATGAGSFECTFPDNGTYDVSVTIEDDDGGSGSDSIAVAVANVDPTVTLTGATSGRRSRSPSSPASMKRPATR